MTAIARNIRRFSEFINEPTFAITTLSLLVARYPPSLSHLTSMHPILLTACVTHRQLAPALPLLSITIEEVDTNLTELTYNDALVYHYAGGVALAMLERWKEAIDFFEIVVGAPGQAPAAIQLEALKKLMLVGLIKNGEVRRSSCVLRSLYEMLNVALAGSHTPKIHEPHYFAVAQELSIPLVDTILPS